MHAFAKEPVSLPYLAAWTLMQKYCFMGRNGDFSPVQHASADLGCFAFFSPEKSRIGNLIYLSLP
jgi:hypothetical protein